MELLDQFGFDKVLLAAQIVNFLIVLFILKKFLYKPVLLTLQKRQAAIKEGLEKAEEARQKLEQVVEDERAILKQAQKESIKIIEDAKDQALSIQKKAQEAAAAHTEKIMQQTQEQIRSEIKQVEERLGARASKLAIDFLERSLKDLFEEKHQEEILRKAIKQIKTRLN